MILIMSSLINDFPQDNISNTFRIEEFYPFSLPKNITEYIKNDLLLIWDNLPLIKKMWHFIPFTSMLFIILSITFHFKAYWEQRKRHLDVWICFCIFLKYLRYFIATYIYASL